MEIKDNSKLFSFKLDNEWYTAKEDVEYFLSKVNIDKNKVIWCPFDNDCSNFVIVLKQLGYNVINSHIDMEKDFYKWEPDHYDIIISNPPFNGKRNIIKRIIELGSKPFALIFGIQAFNSGGYVNELNNLPKVQFMFLTKRIKYVKDPKNYVLKKIPQPTFHSMWVCNNLLEKDVMIE